MPTVLGDNSYGKSAVRLVTVARRGTRHDLRDLTVATALAGAFEAAHLAGDNRAVLPTDTMKNTVYALARAHTGSPLETFATAIGQRLLAATPAATRATIEITQHEWSRMAVRERAHDHAFLRGSEAARLAVATVRRDGVDLAAGITGLGVLKTSGSAFDRFLRDEYTTLRETRDRIFATAVDARWTYGPAPESFDLAWRTVRDALVETFAEHESESVQHTLFAMGAAALERCEAATEIRLSMPNRHHLLVDLTPFGQPNANEVFVATDAPFGLIEAMVRRQ